MALAVATLERSFAQIRPHAAQFAVDFYAELFARYPETVPLFANVDMAGQRKKLMDSLVLVVENLENGDVLQGALAQLGRRHAGWNVQPRHYDMVGATLLHTFARHLGPDWTPDVRQAWTDAYAAIVHIMTSAPTGPRAQA